MQTKLEIEGMSCEHCVKAVKNALEEIGGVNSAEVNLRDKYALVDHGEEVSRAALTSAVEEAGYEAV
jgi:copper ion binding protein